MKRDSEEGEEGGGEDHGTLRGEVEDFEAGFVLVD
uniref:Uncharacterized protein n=1 Tax=Peronospora matthiolae TaxID=2874970 RepID=A0AAV1V3E8_9STRA